MSSSIRPRNVSALPRLSDKLEEMRQQMANSKHTGYADWLKPLVKEAKELERAEAGHEKIAVGVLNDYNALLYVREDNKRLRDAATEVQTLLGKAQDAAVFIGHPKVAARREEGCSLIAQASDKLAAVVPLPAQEVGVE